MQRYTFTMTDDDDDGSESDITVTYTPKGDFVSWDEPLRRFLRFLVMTGYIIDIDDFMQTAGDTISKRMVSTQTVDSRKEKEYKFDHPDEWDDVIRGD